MSATDQSQRDRYIPTTDCAVMIRADLKRHFPSTKFSVRSKSYSGGSSITVSWTDGPTAKQVEAIAQRRKGADFDGMQDLKTYHKDLLLHADGSVEQVHYGADYVFCNRDYTDYAGNLTTLAKRVCASYVGLTYSPDWKSQHVGGEWMDTFVDKILARIDFRSQAVDTVELYL